MTTAETEAPASSESRRQQLLPRAYGRARLPSTLQAQLPAAGGRWQGFGRLRDDLSGRIDRRFALSNDPPTAIDHHVRPMLSFVRNQEAKSDRPVSGSTSPRTSNSKNHPATELQLYIPRRDPSGLSLRDFDKHRFVGLRRFGPKLTPPKIEGAQ